mgnify:CR=1 FL=1
MDIVKINEDSEGKKVKPIKIPFPLRVFLLILGKNFYLVTCLLSQVFTKVMVLWPSKP